MKNLILVTALLTSLVTQGSAQEAIVENLQEIEATRGWSYPYMGPGFDGADLGTAYQKDFQGQVILYDDTVMAIRTDTYGDKIYFSRGEATEYLPSEAALRVGSKVRVRCDHSNNVRWVEIVPYSVWLERQPRPEAKHQGRP